MPALAVEEVALGGAVDDFAGRFDHRDIGAIGGAEILRS